MRSCATTVVADDRVGPRVAAPSTRRCCHGRTLKIGGRPCGAARGRGGGPTGPVRQRSHDPPRSRATAPSAASTCRRSPARRRVEPRGGIASLVAHDHVDDRLARQPEVAHARADDGVVVRRSGTRRPRRRAARIVPASASGRGSAGSVVVAPSRAATRLERRALQQRRDQHREEHDVEELARCPARRRSPGTSRARPGTAPRRPAQPRARRARPTSSRSRASATVDRERPRDERRARARAPSPRARRRRARAGTRAGRATRNIATCATHASPWWNAVTVCWAGMPARAQRRGRRGRRRGSPSRGARRRRRRRAPRSASVATGYRPPVASCARRSARDRAAADADADRPAPIPSCRTNSRRPCRRARSRGRLDPVDEAEHEQHGDRVVEARLALERAREPALAASSRAAARRSPRRRSTRGPRRAAGPRAGREVEQPRGGEAGDDRGDERARRSARLIAGREHRADLEQAGGQAALEQDQRERDDPDRARELVVVERRSSRGRRSRRPSRGRGTAPGRARAGDRRPATRAGPAASSAPATRMSCPSVTVTHRMTVLRTAGPPPGENRSHRYHRAAMDDWGQDAQRRLAAGRLPPRRRPRGDRRAARPPAVRAERLRDRGRAARRRPRRGPRVGLPRARRARRRRRAQPRRGRPGQRPLRGRAQRRAPSPSHGLRHAAARCSRSPTPSSSARSHRLAARVSFDVAEHDIVLRGACPACRAPPPGLDGRARLPARARTRRERLQRRPPRPVALRPRDRARPPARRDARAAGRDRGPPAPRDPDRPLDGRPARALARRAGARGGRRHRAHRQLLPARAQRPHARRRAGRLRAPSRRGRARGASRRAPAALRRDRRAARRRSRGWACARRASTRWPPRSRRRCSSCTRATTTSCPSTSPSPPPRRHPAWSVATLRAGGHNAHVERPAEWLDAVSPWLSRRSARPLGRARPRRAAASQTISRSRPVRWASGSSEPAPR